MRTIYRILSILNTFRAVKKGKAGIAWLDDVLTLLNHYTPYEGYAKFSLRDSKEVS